VSGRITPRIETEGALSPISAVPNKGAPITPAPNTQTPNLATSDFAEPSGALDPQAMFAAPPMPVRIAPRIEAEALPALRLEALPDIPQPVLRAGWVMPALVASGAAVLVLGLSGLEAGNFVADEFTRSVPLGYGALAVSTVGFGLIGTGFLREARALAALRSVDRLRADLLGRNAQRRVRAAREWVRTLPEAEALLPAINAINDPDAVLALLRAGPAATLRSRADALGRAAAVQAVAGIAAMPSPGLAALYIAWRGLRLVRQVAALHGLRPGLFGTLALLRRTALSAGAVAGAEMAANAAAHAVLSNAMLQHVAGEMAGAGVAARRMVVLARAADAACSPLGE
jgi:putative membrane protein